MEHSSGNRVAIGSSAAKSIGRVIVLATTTTLLAKPTLRHRLALLLVAIWLPAMGWLLWQFERQQLEENHQQLADFDSRALPDAPTDDPSGLAQLGLARPSVARPDVARPNVARREHISVLYFIDPLCPCQNAAFDEIRALQSQLAPNTAQWAVQLDSAATPTTHWGQLRWLDSASAALWRGRVPAAPAVAIWDQRQHLAYFGPLSGGSNCGGAGSYAASVLARLSQGQPGPAWPRLAMGCFCSRALRPRPSD